MYSTSLLGDTLELVNVSREFSGEYICNAENGVGGPIREAMELNVLCKYNLGWSVDFFFDRTEQGK